jgi:lysozyme
MNSQNLATLIAELRRDEAVRYSPYKDTKGILTVGVGHNLVAHPLPAGWKYPLNDIQVNSLLDDDLESVFHDLDGNLPWWTDLSDVRQRALANFVFQLGIIKALGFTKSLPLIRQGKYTAAAENMLLSDWAKQTPLRAKRVTEMIRTGQPQG